MSHLAVEESLKGLLYERRKMLPPRTHNLMHLLGEVGVRPPEELGRFIAQLSSAGIPTRYPEDLDALQHLYTAENAGFILTRSREVVAWIKALLKE
jgi:HEPN domain-containing protein